MIKISDKVKSIVEGVASFLESIAKAAKDAVADSELSFSDVGIVNDLFKSGKALFDVIFKKDSE